ncbi:MAG: hypothetical protein AABW67_00480 [Nanoarchaeota archaeon]
MKINEYNLQGIRYADVEAAFDLGIEALTKKGYHLISLEESANLRIQGGASTLSHENYTKEAFLFIPKKGIFLTPVSPIIPNAKEATRLWSEKSGRYYLTSNQVEESLLGAICLSEESIRIPTNRFGDESIPKFMFGNLAEKYGDFLKENKIDSIYINMFHFFGCETKPSAGQVYFTKDEINHEINLSNYNNKVVGIK